MIDAFLSQVSFVSFLIILLLSVTNNFFLDFPIAVQTSIQLMNGFSIPLGLWIIWRTRGDKFIYKPKNESVLDILVLLYLFSNIITLLSAPQIFSMSGIRSLFSSSVVFFFTRLFPFTKKEKGVLLSILAGYTILLSLAGVLHFLFPTTFNAFANAYFYGASFSTYDFQRGRLLPWGYLVVTFPFFLSSLYHHITPPYRFFKSLYILYMNIGILLIGLVVVLSNARWFAMCMLAELLFYLYVWKRNKIPSTSSLKLMLMLVVSIMLVGLILAKLQFGYNLLDRIQLVDKSRDVVETLSRIQLFEQAYLLFSSSPFFGVGRGGYMLYDSGTIKHQIVPPHNIFLETLAEEGIIGFLFFSSISAVALYGAFRARRLNVPVMLALSTALIAYYSYNFFDTLFANSYPFLFFLIGAVTTWREKT